MKFTVNFKTPDVLEPVFSEFCEHLHGEIKQTAEKFIRYGEYITVEFDTEKGTAKVLE